MLTDLLSFVKGVQIRGGESKSASGYGSASGFGPGGPILGGSKSAGTPAIHEAVQQIRCSRLWLRDHQFLPYCCCICCVLPNSEKYSQ